MTAADDPFAVKIRPLKQSVLSQDGVNFVNTTISSMRMWAGGADRE